MKKKWFLSFAAVAVAALGLAQSLRLDDNEFLKALKEMILQWTQALPQDRVYLHTDKPFYKSGESIWFAAYVRNGEDLKASSQSHIVSVELINPKGAIEKSMRIIAQNGVAQGDFEIDQELPGGIYKLRAFTQWMKNEPHPFNQEFVKEIQVQKVVLPRLLMKLDFDRKSYSVKDLITVNLSLRTLNNEPLANQKFVYKTYLAGQEYRTETLTTDAEGKGKITFTLPIDLDVSDGLINVLFDYNGQRESISRSIPILLNQIKVEFFPEGGEPVLGQPTRVAFRATNEFGKAADVEGEIKNQKGETIGKTRSFHDGMGAFEITYKPGETYQAHFNGQKFTLPDALLKGYTLNVKELQKDKLTVSVQSPLEEELFLVLTIRSKVYFSRALAAKAGLNFFEIPLQTFPAGVAVITLFDREKIERAERLVFVNSHRKLNISLATDKHSYKPREKVELTLSVTDERGIGLPGQFSVSVIDDKLFTFADDKQGNILSQLLLEQDLSEKVEDAAFYFDPKEEKALQALDYLLMSKGWRRFVWKEVLTGRKPAISNMAEKTIVGGTVFGLDQLPQEGVKIKLPDGRIQTTKKDGKFRFEDVMLYEPLTLVVQIEGHSMTQTISEYSESIEIFLNPKVYRSVEAPVRGQARLLSIGRAKMLNKIAAMRDDNEETIDFEADEAVPEPAMPALIQMPAAEKIIDDAFKDKDMRAAKAERREAGDAFEALEFKVKYRRAREFPKPVYEQESRVEVRSDFRSTIFWQGNLSTDRNGKAKVVFYNSDEITTFRAICEGIAEQGSVGRAEMTYSCQQAFSLDCKLPHELTMGDEVVVNLVLTNNNSQPLDGKLEIVLPKALKAIEPIVEKVRVAANSKSNHLLRFRVENLPGNDSIYIALLDGNGSRDAIVEPVQIGVKGFPVSLAASGQATEFQTVFQINQPVEGSLKAGFVAYPSVIDDLLAGIESILREPYGCFEQTSSSTYPNIVVLNYLKETGNQDQAVQNRALGLIDKGYKRLIGFETTEKGYEWFGGVPAHEALTAYGLMEFKDMQQVYARVDNSMIERTANYLFSRKDNQGGFQRNPRALDGFGGASPQITNAYIVYAMSEAGYGQQVVEQFEASWLEAKKSADPYVVALLANAVFSVPTKAATARQALDWLHQLRNPKGYWEGKTHSITRSGGQALIIETTALAALALNKIASQPLEKDQMAFREAAQFLVASRNAFGGYGNTQATVLSLKALAAYAAFSKRTAEGGDIEIFVAGKKVAQTSYTKGHKGEVKIEGLEKFLSKGKNEISLRFLNCQNALPYTLKATYSTMLPTSSKECKIALKTVLASNQTKVGETLRLNAALTNTTAEGQPMTIALIGIPAGLAPQPWQLKKMQEEKVFDFYEIIGNRLAVYYRQMKPSETRTFSLDLKAELSGRYEAAASTAYLYYTSEHRNWQPALKVEVK